MALNKPRPGEFNGPRDEPFSDHQMASKYPTLFAYLTDRNWGDGSARLTSTILIFVENGVLRVCINDRDNNRSAFVTGVTLEDALNTVETKLCGETMEWRFKQSFNGNGSKTPF